MKFKTLLLVASLITGPFCGAALAQGSRVYAGANIGPTFYDAKLDIASGIVRPPTSVDKKDTGWSAHIGYNFSEVFGLELGYLDAGEIVAQGTTTTNLAYTVNVETTSMFLRAATEWALGEKLAIIGKLGIHLSDNKYSATSTITRPQDTDSSGLTGGVALAFKFNPRFSLTGGIERFGGKQSVNLLSVGGIIKF